MSDRSQRIKEAVLNNIELKVLSLVLSVIAWSAIHDAISFEQVLPDIPLAIIAKPGEAVLYQSENSVKVTVRGSRTDVLNLETDKIQVIVDLSKQKVLDSGMLLLTPRNVQGVHGVRVTGVHPSAVSVELAKESEKEVPVVVRYSGTPVGGELKSVVCAPEKVVIRGPQQELKGLTEAQTELIDIQGRSKTLTKRVHLVSPSDRWEAHFVPSEVDVTIEIEKKTVTRRWESVPVVAMIQPGDSLRLTMAPAAVDVVLKGAPDMVEALGSQSVKAYVDCIGMKPGSTNQLPVIVYVPSGIEVSSESEPPEVGVTAASE